MASEGIGGRIAQVRKLHGLTGRELARRANVSYSLLSKVESGAVPVTPALTAAAARALSVEVAQLTGQPYREPTQRSARAHAAIPQIRRVLPSFEVPPEEGVNARPLAELRRDVGKVNEYRRLSRYEQLAEILPGVLADVAHAWKLLEGPEHDEATQLLTTTLRATNSLAYKLGYFDLCNYAGERFHVLALFSGDPLLPVVSSYMRAGNLIVAGGYRDGMRLLEAEISRMEPELGAAADPYLSVYGSLHLRAAMTSGRAGNAPTAQGHLQAAHEAASRLDPRVNPYRADYYGLSFAHTNAQLHDVAIAVELGRPGDALDLARDIRTTGLTPERTSHHQIDLARAWIQNGDGKRALASLIKARQHAPQHAKYHPQVREILYTLAARERRTSGTLREFARWVGID